MSTATFATLRPHLCARTAAERYRYSGTQTKSTKTAKVCPQRDDTVYMSASIHYTNNVTKKHAAAICDSCGYTGLVQSALNAKYDARRHNNEKHKKGTR